MLKQHGVALLLSLALSACVSLAPKYQRPAAPVPATWPSGAAYEVHNDTGTTAAELPWRSFIVDENLRRVIELALTNSRDLRKTVANVESARAQYRVQRAAQLPTIDAGISGSRARSLTTGADTGTRAVESQSYSASVGLSSFEIDLFGRLRSLSKAALESYLATAEAAHAARITLIAETASAYLTLAADRTSLALSQRTMESAQRSMALTQKRLEMGVASRVDVRQAETVYQQARADVASLTTSIAQDRNALELLAGTQIDDALLPAELPANDAWLTGVPAGLSSSVLLNRPDVLEAEHNLKSSNANIGAARAAFFPSLSLTASTGLASTELSKLFSNGTKVWSVSSDLTAPIFDGGSNRANLAYAKAQRDLYVANYELAIQTAFKEVADALAQRGTIQEQLNAQQALVEASTESSQLAEARYQKGVDTYLNALDSQRTLYSAEQNLVTTRLTALNNLVTLYRVLGGGLADGG